MKQTKPNIIYWLIQWYKDVYFSNNLLLYPATPFSAKKNVKLKVYQYHNSTESPVNMFNIFSSEGSLQIAIKRSGKFDSMYC